MTKEKFLLINYPISPSQHFILEEMSDCGHSFLNLKRENNSLSLKIPILREFFFPLGTRSLKLLKVTIKNLKKERLNGSILFFNNNNFKGRRNIKLLLLLSRIKIIGISLEGKKRIINENEILFDFFLGFPQLLAKEFVNLWWFIIKLFLKSNSLLNTNKKKKNILYVTYGFYVGGVETVIVNLLNKLNKEKYNPLLLVLIGFVGDGSSLRSIEESGHNLILDEKSELPFSFIKNIYSILKKHQVDIVHYHGNNLESIPVRLAGILAGTKIIAHIHGTPDAFIKLKPWNERSFLKLLSQKTDAFIVVSSFIKNFVIKNFLYPHDKVIIIKNGIDLSNFQRSEPKEKAKKILGFPPDKKIICMAGRLSFEKGHLILLKALKILNGSNYKCIICGDGPLEDEIKNKLKEFSLEGSVELLGYRKDMPLILDAVDLVVQPSLMEAFGLVIVEAMTKGIPVIATRIGGIPEIINDGKNGILVPPDDPGALADAIIKVLADDYYALQIGSRAQKDATKFSDKYFIEGVQEIYERIY